MSNGVADLAVWAGIDHLSLAEAEDFARRVEAAGYGGLWTRESMGREPFQLMARLAAVAPSLTVGTGIANVHARDPVAMRAAAGTLHELTGGRAILGLGVGHKTSVEEVRGGTYGRPVETMRRYLEAYAAAPYRGPVPHGAPQVVIAALRERMVDLAGTASDGNATVASRPLQAHISVRRRVAGPHSCRHATSFPDSTGVSFRRLPVCGERAEKSTDNRNRSREFQDRLGIAGVASSQADCPSVQRQVRFFQEFE
jgi:alkanesulfonate monooxygenase SsuD/methylene tetrahydromethanopterin reductase-like flavin-dependent oxidoreductase (luciferase family)